jgi:hypothetical protein
MLSYPGTLLLIADNWEEKVRVSSKGSLKISRRAVVWFYKLQGKTDAVGVVISEACIFRSGR